MKTLITLLHILFLVTPFVLAEPLISYTRNGVSIVSTDQEPTDKFDPDFPRKMDMNSQMILKRADAFLRSAFGNGFKPHVSKISLHRKRSVKDYKYYWEWTVAYIKPEEPGDVRSPELILIPLSVDGNVLMRINRK